jgi:hypothetical protein
MISTALFKVAYEYRPFSDYIDGLHRLISVVRSIAIEEKSYNIFIRVYYNKTVDDYIIDELRRYTCIELVEYESYNGMLDERNLLGALLRYKPFFEREYNVDYVLVMDLDLPRCIFEEYLNMLPDMKKCDFVYNYRKWYRSGRYWYDIMNRGNKSAHLVRGWGLGGKPGLLYGNSLLDFYLYEMAKPYCIVKDNVVRKFRELNSLNNNMSSKQPHHMFTWGLSDKFQYGVVELFTTFYLLPAVLISNASVLQIVVQYNILVPLIRDLLGHVQEECKDPWFMDCFNMKFTEFCNAIACENRIGGDIDFIRLNWKKLIIMLDCLIKIHNLKIREDLWKFMASDDFIVGPDNNKKVLDKDEKNNLIKRLLNF